MPLESLTPIQEITIVRAGVSTHLPLSLDLRLIVPPELEETLSVFGLRFYRKHRSFVIFSVPVSLDEPVFPLVVVSFACPCHQLPMQVVVTRLKGFLGTDRPRSEEHTSELQSPCNLVCRLLLEKKKKKKSRLHICNYNILLCDMHLS